MLEGMRHRAPNSTRITGASITMLALAGAGYAMTTGARLDFMPAIPAVTTIATLPPEKDETREETVRLFNGVTSEKLRPPEPLSPDFPEFIAPDSPGVAILPGGSEQSEARGARPSPAPPAPAAPRLRPGAPPPYPPQEIRAAAEGITSLEVCVDARGRVTDAKVTSPSGRSRLDEAALEWVKSARFEPGRVNGAPAAMCGHSVVYEWRLERVRR